jgi:hypothetical protein
MIIRKGEIMRSSMFRSAVVGFGVLLAGTSMVPAEAMPVPNPSITTSSDVQTVRDNDQMWRHRGRATHNFRGARSHAWRGNRGWHGNRGFHYWRGHRGYRYHRPGYRFYGGWWYPPAAFSVGVVIGGHAHGSRHVRWCYNHYRSYRASDNTFQPNSGPRRACVSPYSR